MWKLLQLRHLSCTLKQINMGGHKSLKKFNEISDTKLRYWILKETCQTSYHLYQSHYRQISMVEWPELGQFWHK
jgi:hypothetical protein